MGFFRSEILIRYSRAAADLYVVSTPTRRPAGGVSSQSKQVLFQVAGSRNTEGSARASLFIDVITFIYCFCCLFSSRVERRREEGENPPPQKTGGFEFGKHSLSFWEENSLASGKHLASTTEPDHQICGNRTASTSRLHTGGGQSGRWEVSQNDRPVFPLCVEHGPESQKTNGRYGRGDNRNSEQQHSREKERQEGSPLPAALSLSLAPTRGDTREPSAVWRRNKKASNGPSFSAGGRGNCRPRRFFSPPLLLQKNNSFSFPLQSSPLYGGLKSAAPAR